MAGRKELIEKKFALIDGLVEQQLRHLQSQFSALRPVPPDATKEEILHNAERAITEARALCLQLHDTCLRLKGALHDTRQLLEVSRMQRRDVRRRLAAARLRQFRE
ncbi:MAG TPA: hypothetical protein VNO70_24385 [Blastocatellia bacterium]|nr:hypothetical protein [Blastocatellia bacterium]